MKKGTISKYQEIRRKANNSKYYLINLGKKENWGLYTT